MKRFISKHGVLLLALVFGSCVECRAAEPASSPKEIKAILKKVADWQIKTFEDMGKYRALPPKPTWQTRNRYHDLTWHCGALYAGMYEWSTIADDPKYVQWLVGIGERNDWKLHRRPYHADDHTVGQFYLNLYEDLGDEAMIGPTRERFDWILKNPKKGTLEWDAPVWGDPIPAPQIPGRLPTRHMKKRKSCP